MVDFHNKAGDDNNMNNNNNISEIDFHNHRVSQKKINRYCKKNPTVKASCPLTCDNCVSNAPTDGYVCEDSIYEFSVPDKVAKYTCESLDRQFNVPVVNAFCDESAEIKAMCPVPCDNCVPTSPSASSTFI